MSNDYLELELLIKDDKVDVVLSRSKQKLTDFVKEAEKAQPNIKFKVEGQSYIDLTRLEAKAKETRQSFAAIAATRLNSGNVGLLTRDVVKAHERARQLETDIKNIHRELANPNRKSSIAFLTDELKVAQRESDQLERKLRSLPSQGAAANTALSGGNGGGNNLKLSSFQKQNLSYQINDVLTGVASGQNLTQIAAQQSGQIAQIFNPTQAAALVSAYGSLVTILGAGAAAIALTYKITGDLRAEAEKRLKNEIALTVEYGKQQTAARALIADLEKAKQDRAFGFAFASQLPSLSDEALQRRRATARQLASFAPRDENGNASEIYLKNKQIEADIDAEFERRRQTREKSLADSVNQRWESWKRSQADAVEFAKKKQAEFEQSVEKGRKKVEEMEKQYLSLFDSVYARTNANNPFVALYSEADKALKTLRDNSKGLSGDVISQLTRMEQKAANLKLFEARLDNRLSASGLRADAANFRNPFDQNRQTKEQNEFIERFLRDNPNYLYLENKTEIDDAERQRILRRFAPSSLTETAADRFNKQLENQLNLIYNGNTPQPIADKKFIGLTQGANPLELSDKLREQAAQAREREALRVERAEAEAAAQRKTQIEYQKKIVENTAYLKAIAEKEGFKGVIEILDKSGGGAKVLGASPTPNDTAKTYDLGFYGGTNR